MRISKMWLWIIVLLFVFVLAGSLVAEEKAKAPVKPETVPAAQEAATEEDLLDEEDEWFFDEDYEEGDEDLELEEELDLGEEDVAGTAAPQAAEAPKKK